MSNTVQFSLHAEHLYVMLNAAIKAVDAKGPIDYVIFENQGGNLAVTGTDRYIAVRTLVSPVLHEGDGIADFDSFGLPVSQLKAVLPILKAGKMNVVEVMLDFDNRTARFGVVGLSGMVVPMSAASPPRLLHLMQGIAQSELSSSGLVSLSGSVLKRYIATVTALGAQSMRLRVDVKGQAFSVPIEQHRHVKASLVLMSFRDKTAADEMTQVDLDACGLG